MTKKRIYILIIIVLALFIGFFLSYKYYLVINNEMPIDKISGDDLKKEIISGVNLLLANGYETNLGLKISEYAKEYNKRGEVDLVVDSALNNMLEKFGPCWGIPTGECRE